MKKIFHFILSHSIFIAFCAAGLVIQTYQLLQLPVNYPLTAFIFFATVCSYNFYWLISKHAFGARLFTIRIVKKELMNIVLLFLGFAGMVIFFSSSLLNIYNVLVGCVLTCIYALPLLPISILKFTKRLGILKTLVLAFTWAYVTVIIPLNRPFIQSTNAEVFILCRRFLFMLMLCIIFDSRDSAMDKIRGMHSLATDLSAKALRGLVIIVFVALFATFLFHDQFGITLYQSVALQLSTIALLIVFIFSLKKQGYFFYYFLVDGMMLFSAIATYIASI